MPLQAGIVPVTPFQQNCTLIWDDASKRGAVVDPGGDLDRIEAAIAKVGMTVERILLTHGHVDHAAGAAELKEKLGGIPIEGPHEADRFLLDSLTESALAFGMPGARNVRPDRWLAEGDEIQVRLMMPLSLSYDHRLVDGATAARFLNDVIEFLEVPGRLLLAP